MTIGESTTTDQAITRLYESYAAVLLRFLQRLTGNPETAEDILQETFIKVYRSWSQLQHSDNERAWLFRIARNCAYDYFRRQRHRNGVALEAIADEALVALPMESRVEEREPIGAALAQLPAEYRAALVMHSHAGYSLEFIAERFDLKIGTVKSRLSRARAQFRAHYGTP